MNPFAAVISFLFLLPMISTAQAETQQTQFTCSGILIDIQGGAHGRDEYAYPAQLTVSRVGAKFIADLDVPNFFKTSFVEVERTIQRVRGIDLVDYSSEIEGSKMFLRAPLSNRKTFKLTGNLHVPRFGWTPFEFKCSGQL